MARKQSRYHLRKGDVYQRAMYDGAKDYQATWCGEDWVAEATYYWTEDPQHKQVCGKCSKAFFKAQPANGFRLGDSLTKEEMERIGVKWGWRALYPILGPDGHYGFVGFPTGWGGRFHIRRWESNARFGNTKQLAEDPDWKPTLSLAYSALGEYGSAEAALADMPRLAADGDVKSRKQIAAQGLEWVRGFAEREAKEAAEKARQQAERAEWQAQRQKDKETAQQAFYEVFHAITTTDHQREGLRIVASLAGLTVEEKQA